MATTLEMEVTLRALRGRGRRAARAPEDLDGEWGQELVTRNYWRLVSDRYEREQTPVRPERVQEDASAAW